MFDHIGVSVTDFESAKAFYDKALAPLGYTLVAMVPEIYTNGVKVGGYGKDRPQFWLSEGATQTPPLHIAFSANSRADVIAFYEAAMTAGGRDNGAPGLRPHYHADYFGAFVLDPDGNNIEAVCHLPEPTE